MAFSWFGWCHILSRCGLEKALSFLSKHSCPIRKPLLQIWPQLTSAFSQIQGDKTKTICKLAMTRLALGLLQREKRYLSLIYFNAKNCLLGTNAVFFTPRNTVATSTVLSKVPDQYNHSCCSNPRVVYLNFYVCLHLSQMMIA